MLDSGASRALCHLAVSMLRGYAFWCRVEGLKRAAAVAVGEKHSLAVQRWSAAQLEGMVAVPWLHPAPAAAASVAAAAADDDRWFQQAADADSLMDGGQLATPRGLEAEPSSADSPASMSPGRPSPVRPGPRRSRAAEAAGVPSLQRICEEEVARRLVDPRTCLPVLEYADVAGAEVLRAYCLAVAVCNLDAVLLEAGGAFEELAPHLLGELERLFKLRLAGAGASGSSAQAAGGAAAAAGALDPEPAGPAASEEGAAAEAGSKQRQEVPQPGSLLQPGRRPTAAAPWLGDEGVEVGGLWASGAGLGFQPMALAAGGSSFRDRSQADAEAATQRLLRTLQKKLQQIEHLEAKAAGGAALDPQQQAKVQQKPVIQSAAAALEGGMALDDVQSILRAAAAGREPEAALGLGSGGGSSSKAAGAAATAPASVGKQAKSRGKKGCHKPDAVAGDGSSSAAPVAAAASDAEPFLAAEASGSLLGSSPPSSSLVPAFGPAGSAAAPDEQPQTPAAATEPPSAPVGQVRSLVGFASCSASDGVGAAAQRQSGQQLPAGARPSGGGSSKPKSASKRKGEQARGCWAEASTALPELYVYVWHALFDSFPEWLVLGAVLPCRRAVHVLERRAGAGCCRCRASHGRRDRRRHAHACARLGCQGRRAGWRRLTEADPGPGGGGHAAAGPRRQAALGPAQHAWLRWAANAAASGGSVWQLAPVPTMPVHF